MKRILMTLTSCAILLLAGCGQGGANTAEFSGQDLQLSIDGAGYRINMDIENIIAEFGTDYEYAEGMSCDYDGLDKTYAYDFAVFYTNPLSAGDMVSEIYTESELVSTSKGITVGSARSEVLAAHGEDCEDEGDLLIYRLSGERAFLCFEIENDTVWAIYLTNQSV